MGPDPPAGSVSLRSLVHENRGPQGTVIWSLTLADGTLTQVTGKKPTSAEHLEAERTAAIEQLARFLAQRGMTIADVRPSTDPHGVDLT